jgi:hypothetical protein
MQIHIEILYLINNCVCMRQANLPINYKNFKDDPDNEAVRITMNWLWKIKKEHGYDLSVTKVTYDQNDITDKVRRWIKNG